MTKIAIMQPYFFPYIGYFQLVNAVDVFVSLDNVSFIKKGWIHRNRLCFNGAAHWCSVPIDHASQFKTIRETLINEEEFILWKNKLYASIFSFYKKESHYDEGMNILESVLAHPGSSIADLAFASVRACCDALGISTHLEESSVLYDKIGSRKEARLIEICRQRGANMYINAPGGQSLYSADMFAPYGIRLAFLHPTLIPYAAKRRPFTPGLSVLDAIMCCGSAFVRDSLLNTYDIVEAA